MVHLSRARREKPGGNSTSVTTVRTNLHHKCIKCSPSELRLRGMNRREITRCGGSSHVDIPALAIECYAAGEIISVAAKIARENQACAGTVQLSHEDVQTASIGALKRPQNWKIGRCCMACHKSIAVRIDSYPCASLIASTAQVRGINEGRAAGIDFRHESLELPGQVGLQSSRSGWKIARGRAPGNIRITRKVDCGSEDDVEITATQVRRVDQRCACGIELCQESITAAGISLERVVRRKVSGARVAIYVNASSGINRDLRTTELKVAAT